MESKKMILMNSLSGKQRRKRHGEQTHGHGGVEEGQGETYAESNMETHNTTCKTDSQREPAVWPRGLKRGPCDNSCDRGAMQRELGGPEGRGPERTYVWPLLKYIRKPQNSSKQLSFNKKDQWKKNPIQSSDQSEQYFKMPATTTT